MDIIEDVLIEAFKAIQEQGKARGGRQVSLIERLRRTVQGWTRTLREFRRLVQAGDTASFDDMGSMEDRARRYRHVQSMEGAVPQHIWDARMTRDERIKAEEQHIKEKYEQAQAA